MLQVNFIRQNKEYVLERLSLRGFKDLQLVDELLENDEKRRTLKATFDQIQAKINAASKEIGQLMKTGKKAEAEDRKGEVATFKQKLQPIQEELQQTDQKLNALLVKLPNLPHQSVPKGLTSEANEIVREGGKRPELNGDALPHWELAQKYNLIDFDLGVKITGSGFPVYINDGARLQQALIRFFLDYNISNGYTQYMPPLLVNEATAFGTGQLPDKEGQMYYACEDNYYLIPTAEVPLTNIHRDTILKMNELPVKMTAYTPCFRREAGSYGKDVRGLNRLHQFDKVEIVQIVYPDHSYEVLDKMVTEVEQLIRQLQLPYRILRLCGGDMGFTSALTFDLEVYSAVQKRWLEVSSVSNFETFQTNRMKIRFKKDKGKTELLHSLNGSSLALPRIVACLLENNQQPDGIYLPEVLHPYFGKEKIG